MDAEFVPILLIIIISFLFLSKYCHAYDNITASQELSQEKTLISSGQIFELGFFTPQNNSGNHKYVGIWYKGTSPQTVVWVANREKPLRVADSQASLMIADDGNLQLVDGNRSFVWSTDVHVPSNTSSVATLSDDGNLVLKDGKSGDELWQSFENLGDTLLPGSSLGFNVKTGQNYVLTSWKGDSDPSLGNFSVGVSSKLRPVQVFTWVNGSTPYWRSGPWDKLKFIGIPEMGVTYQSPFAITEDAEQGTTSFSFKPFNSSISRMYISSEGVFKYQIKENGGDWQVDWMSPKSRCDVYGVCGPFGVCKESEYPICKCLKGFVPKANQEWSKGNWIQGCVRQTELLCQKNASSSPSKGGNKDGFQTFGNMKLPDFYEYVDSAYEVDTCQTWCLDNCSCVAYAYVNSIGCLIWSEDLVDIQEFAIGGEDLFLRLAHEELDGGQKNRTIIISLATVSSVVTFGAILLICLRRWRTKQKRNIKDTTEELHFVKKIRNSTSTPVKEQNDPSELPTFDFNSILVATDYFNVKNKLGQGGFGPVYKGKLPDGTEIAVKRLSSSSGQGMQELKNEMTLISKLQHRNLVRLLGCCIEKEERLLIYEFMLNKSLDNFIFDSRRKTQLNWPTRFNIINGVARGLVYLHRDSCLRVIHRDLKVSNILLDENMNPKISDFGMARIFEGTVDIANTRRVVGTLGYMSPEYAMGGIFSEKSDVFSFGVLLLEIVSCQKNTSFYYDHDKHLSLIAYAWHLWSEKRELDVVDTALGDSYSSSEAARCIHVGLLCVQDHVTDRPTMPDVIFMLSNETDLPQPKQPLFIFQSLSGSELQQHNDSKCSVNEVTTTSIIEGR